MRVRARACVCMCVSVCVRRVGAERGRGGRSRCRDSTHRTCTCKIDPKSVRATCTCAAAAFEVLDGYSSGTQGYLLGGHLEQAAACPGTAEYAQGRAALLFDWVASNARLRHHAPAYSSRQTGRPAYGPRCGQPARTVGTNRGHLAVRLWPNKQTNSAYVWALHSLRPCRRRRVGAALCGMVYAVDSVMSFAARCGEANERIVPSTHSARGGTARPRLYLLCRTVLHHVAVDAQWVPTHVPKCVREHREPR